MGVINTNIKALFSQHALRQTEGSMSKAMAQLSTGKRINTAGDDAAGLAIATRMTHQIRSLDQAVRNSADGISLIQTAEGATNEITDMMIRMRELAIQAVNDTNANEQRSYLDLEFQQLKQEIVRVAETTEWNGFPVLSGEAGERVGEMPVYKATSVSHFGDVFINPTTVRTMSGTQNSDGVGEKQEVSFAAVVPATGAAGLIKIAGIEINVDASNFTDLSTYLTFVKDQLTADPQFSPDSGRSVTVSDGDKLVFTYAATDGDVDAIVVSPHPFTTGPSGTNDVRKAVTDISERFTSSNGKFLKSGSLNIEYAGGSTIEARFVTDVGESTLMTGSIDTTTGKITFDPADNFNGTILSGSIEYQLKDSTGTAVTDLDTGNREFSLAVRVEGSIPALRAGDLQINGVEIGPSSADDDKASPPNNASGSAIAKAAAINRRAIDTGMTAGETQTIAISGLPKPGTVVIGGVAVQITSAESTSVLATAKIAATLKASDAFGRESGRTVSYAPGSTTLVIDFAPNEGDVAKLTMSPGTTELNSLIETTRQHSTMLPGTGVFAKVNQNVFTGQAMESSSVVTGTVFINGYSTPDVTTILNNPRQTRAQVVTAINAISDKTGVKAVDTGFDSQGVTLLAADGRNIEVRFETTANAEVFGKRLGLRQGVQSSTISLESKIQTPVLLSSSSTGDITRAGLIEGNFTKNQSVVNSDERPPVLSPVAQSDAITITRSAELTVGEKFSVTINGRTYTHTVAATTESAQAIRDSLMAKVNADSDVLGVTAYKGSTEGEVLLEANTPGVPYTFAVTEDSATATMTSLSVNENQPAQYKALNEGDLVINGIKVRASTSADDKQSSSIPYSSDPSSSAIAIATAINASSTETGVRAQANPVVSKGIETSTDYPESGTYDLFVNGTKISIDFVQGETESARRLKVVEAINERAGQHGVSAADNGNGVTIESDGRNLAIWFDGSVPGLTAASFGLEKGGAVAQKSTITIGGTVASGNTASIDINGVSFSPTAPTATTPATLASALYALLVDEQTNGTDAQKEALANLSFALSGAVITVTSEVAGTPFDLRGAAADVDATVTLNPLVRNSLGDNDVTAIRGASATSKEAKTLYGTVRMISDPALLPMGLPSPIGAPPSDQEALLRANGKPFTVEAGDKGFSGNGNFSALGFQTGTFGGRASMDLDPPKVGRLAFQVGASSNQLITIDLGDFGKKGPITGEITGDVDLNVEQRSVRINSREGASSVLALLDSAMDKVNATRATMGAVMNRLQHTITNLSNVSTNLSASRSQIEDANYAKASTELAKTQIMQQAATAVLAQANQSQQTVLKLLG
jgi:flagellin